MDLSIFLLVPLPVKSVSLEWTQVGVGLVIATAVQTFEQMRTWLAFLGFQSWWVDLGVGFATPAKFSVVFGFVRTITFNILGFLDFAGECCVTPLPTVFALWNSGVHVGSSDSCDEVADVEVSVD